MFYWNKICGIILIFLFSAQFLAAQSLITFNPDKQYFNDIYKFNTQNSSTFLTAKKVDLPPVNTMQGSIPENFSTTSYGFFCRKELIIEKATKIPFRFRLGSLEQCNYYEGKKQ
jgi:hypothetical protein